jgi:hypothetical protein
VEALPTEKPLSHQANEAMEKHLRRPRHFYKKMKEKKSAANGVSIGCLAANFKAAELHIQSMDQS